jgi:hypothetical protein
VLPKQTIQVQYTEIFLSGVCECGMADVWKSAFLRGQNGEIRALGGTPKMGSQGEKLLE